MRRRRSSAASPGDVHAVLACRFDRPSGLPLRRADCRESLELVAGGANDQDRHFGSARRDHRSPVPRPGRPDRQDQRSDPDRREQAGWRWNYRGRDGGARRARRQYAAGQHQRHGDQRDPAEGQLRPGRELRADLLSRAIAAGDRRQQRVALPHAGRSDRRGARQARRTVDRQRRPQYHPAHRDRTAQAACRHQPDLCALYRRRARDQRTARRTRDRGVAELFGDRRATAVPASYARWRRLRPGASSRCRTCRRWRSPATRTSMPRCGSGW